MIRRRIVCREGKTFDEEQRDDGVFGDELTDDEALLVRAPPGQKVCDASRAAVAFPKHAVQAWRSNEHDTRFYINTYSETGSRATVSSYS
jgi:hypothetical protein